VPELPDLWGPAFEAAYLAAEGAGKAARTVRARELYGRMMRTLAETGNGWMTFKDTANARCNQTSGTAGDGANVVHLSNLCTEILEVTSAGETAVCNLGSLNLARHVDASTGTFAFDKLRANVRVALRQLDRVIDLSYYPIPAAKAANVRWRPVGLGVMGLQDVFFALRLPFDGPAARALSTRIQEEIYLSALETSAALAAEKGAHPSFSETRASAGALQPDLAGVTPSAEQAERYAALKARVAQVGLRNSLLIAIAPTATIASIAGCYECIEPQISNLWKRETLSGDFLQVNRFLVDDLKALGLWTDATRAALKQSNGSVQGLAGLPDEAKALYRTAWELPMRALVDMAAARGPFIDQGQSLNLFIESPTIGALSSMYFHAWKQGLKTTYYLRSRPATEIAKATISAAGAAAVVADRPSSPLAPANAVACSLENPGACEACQ